MSETDQQRWIRKVGDAASAAVEYGADPETVLAAVREGIAQGQRLRALRSGQSLPETTPVRKVPTPPPPGSAIERLMRAVGTI